MPSFLFIKVSLPRLAYQSYSRWVCGVIKRQKLETGIFKPEFMSWIRTRNERSVISDLPIHKLFRLLHKIFVWSDISKLIIINQVQKPSSIASPKVWGGQKIWWGPKCLILGE